MMKKIWLTALVSFLPLTAGAEVYTLPGVVVTAEGQKESTLSPRETITEKDMKRMGASNVVEALAMADRPWSLWTATAWLMRIPLPPET